MKTDQNMREFIFKVWLMTAEHFGFKMESMPPQEVDRPDMVIEYFLARLGLKELPVEKTEFLDAMAEFAGVYLYPVSPEPPGPVEPEIPQPQEPTDREKITVPVGVIRWDGWFTTLIPDDPIDITKETRYALSDERTKDQAPFFSRFHPDEVLNKQRWNNESKQWEWDKVTANVRFDGDRPGVIEQEVEYAAGAGIDYFLFNYYATDATPMAIARQQFEALPDKKGLKAAYIMENIGGNPANEAKRIAAAFQQGWYQKIDGKPLLVLPASGSHDFDRVYDIFLTIKSAYGGEIYSVIQMMGAPSEMAGECRKRGYNSHTRYMTWGGWNEGDRSHRYIMDREWEYYQESARQSVDFAPNLTVSFYQVGAQKSWDGSPDYVYSEKATDAEFEEQISRLTTFVNSNKIVKTAILYSWNEFSEGGRAVCPQLRRDGTVDDRILKKLSEFTK